MTTPNNLNTLGPLGTELKDRLNDKIGPCPTNDLTGKWIANDGGVYYIDQKFKNDVKADYIRWFGSTLFNDDSINSHTGFSYANIAFGWFLHDGEVATIKETGKSYSNGNGFKYMLLAWTDINISDNHLDGGLLISVDPSGSKLTKLYDRNGIFGPSEWTRKC